MKRMLLILTLILCQLSTVNSQSPDDYVDDIYFTPQMEVEEAMKYPIEPHYNPQAKEIVFVVDTVNQTSPNPSQGGENRVMVDTLRIEK